MKNIVLAGIVVTVIILAAASLTASRTIPKGKMILPSRESTSQINQSITDSANVRSQTKPLNEKLDESKNTLALTIVQPTPGLIVKDPNLTVIGKTKANAQIAVNDQETKADLQGDFSVDLILDEGENIINIVANDDYGNMAEKEIAVSYSP